MTTPTITPTPAPLPNRSQGKTDFNNSVESYMTWLEANADELALFIDWVVQSRDDVIAAALAGNLPDLTGQALRFLQVNAAETGVTMQDLLEIPDPVGNDGKLVGIVAGVPAYVDPVVPSTSGTWAPVLNDGSTATSTGADGLYSRVGDMVTLSFHMRGIAKGDIGTSNLLISGLPYAPRNLTNSQLQFLGVFNQENISGVTDAQLRLDEGTGFIAFKKGATLNNANLVTGSDLSASGVAINGTITYFTDDPV